MTRTHARRLLGILLLAGTLLCSCMAAADPDGSVAGQTRVIVLGRISDDPRAHHDRLKPLLDYVVARLGDLGIEEGRVLMARDVQTMISYLRQGQVDWVTETAGTAIQLIERAGAEPILRGWRGGLASYHSLIIVRRDSGVDGLSDLKRRSIGFQRPQSTSAYLVPAGMLLEAGLPLAIMLSALDRPRGEVVGYTFTGDEANSVAWVHKRLVDAAAISNQDWNELVLPVDAYREDLRIIARSQDYPRALELVRADLPVAIRERLVAILEAAHLDPDAKAALEAYSRTQRFDAIDDEVRAQLAKLAGLIRRVREELE